MSGPASGPGAVGRVLLAAVRFYQRAISPALPPRCRFYPSCSAYAVEAIERHGAPRGSWLALRRLLKCAPWHPGGVDLVPEPRAGRLPGTREVARSSSFRTSDAAAASQNVDGRSPQPDRAIPPAPGRTAEQEAGVA